MARRAGARTGRVHRKLNGAAFALLSLAAFALLLWWVAEVSVHLAIATAIVVAIVIDGILADRAVRYGVIHLHSPGESPVGEPIRWSVRIERWTRPVTVTPMLTATDRPLLVDDGQPGTLWWPPMRRGPVAFVIVDLKSTGPLGLMSAGRRHLTLLPAPLYVTPVPIETRVDWPTPRAVSFGLAERAPSGDDLFRTIRPYLRGDERRRVDWKSTAHHGELMVRESEGTGVVMMRMVVDLGPPGPAAEVAAGTAAWVAVAAIDRGWNVEMVTLDAGRVVPQITAMGRPFGMFPTVAPPPVVALPTVCAPVRSASEVRRRLATAAHGTPAVSSGGGRRAFTCRVTQAGLEWS